MNINKEKLSEKLKNVESRWKLDHVSFLDNGSNLPLKYRGIDYEVDGENTQIPENLFLTRPKQRRAWLPRLSEADRSPWLF